MRAALLALIMLCAASRSLLAQCGEEPAAPWSLMNATLERISVDTNSSRGDQWRDASLPASDSVAFDGELTGVKVRLTSGRVLKYKQRDIAFIRTRSHLQRGDWLIDQTGLRFVSCADRQRIFQLRKRHMKDLTGRWSEPSPAVRSHLKMIKTVSVEAELAPGGGRSACSR
jgi:hypothetical protein